MKLNPDYKFVMVKDGVGSSYWFKVLDCSKDPNFPYYLVLSEKNKNLIRFLKLSIVYSTTPYNNSWQKRFPIFKKITTSYLLQHNLYFVYETDISNYSIDYDFKDIISAL